MRLGLSTDPRGGVDWRVLTVLVGGAVCLCLRAAATRGQLALSPLPDWFPIATPRLIAQVLLPAAILLAIGENPLRYLRPFPRGTDRRTAAAILAVVSIIGTALVLTESSPRAALEAAVELLCVEFFYRGFLLFPLLPRLGWHAVAVSTLPYGLAHAGAGLLELFGSIPFGLFAGILAVRTGSVVLPWTLHLVLAVLAALDVPGFR